MIIYKYIVRLPLYVLPVCIHVHNALYVLICMICFDLLNMLTWGPFHMQFESSLSKSLEICAVILDVERVDGARLRWDYW